ncbi:unnamed protein product [Polarella glacialis]|uniref:Uncharacterized protein n=1 Tax=Polarella glacialis TaxID=89957 RepID=A0A813DQ13_POLGL|nr:unnamed protein product [Polarella glacialis]
MSVARTGSGHCGGTITKEQMASSSWWTAATERGSGMLSRSSRRCCARMRCATQST